jgi:hypothetical protein
MKRIKYSLIILFLLTALSYQLLAPPQARAAPYIVCDPQTGVQFYKITGWTSPSEPAQTDGAIKLDVAAAPVGTTSLTFKACAADPAWGEVCSVATPFDLVRPGAPAKPVNIMLKP